MASFHLGDCKSVHCTLEAIHSVLHLFLECVQPIVNALGEVTYRIVKTCYSLV